MNKRYYACTDTTHIVAAVATLSATLISRTPTNGNIIRRAILSSLVSKGAVASI